jgi:hypothetical protein
MSNRPARLVLLVIAITFLARDFRDVTAVSPAPIVRFAVPQAPSIAYEGHIEATTVKPPTLGPKHREGSKKQEPRPQVPTAAEKPEESVPASIPAPQQPSPIISAPNGIAIGGGLVANPTVNNFGPPPAHLSYTEEVVTPLPASGEGLKIMKIHVTTDRSIRGAIVGIVFSGPIEPITPGKDEPQLKGAGISQMNWGEGLQHDSTPIPNSLGIVINAPSVFMPGQELIVTVKSKTDLRVIEVGPVQ